MPGADGSTIFRVGRGANDNVHNGHRKAGLGPVVRRSVSPSPLRYEGIKSVDTSQNIRGRPSSTPPARLARQSSKSSLHSVFDNAGIWVDDDDSFLIKPQPATEFHSLPVISSIRRHITMLKDEEDSRQLRARVSFLLVKARGEVCDWCGTSSERLQMLPELLNRANMASELTRLLSDPLYLEMRLRVGPLRGLLADFDLCESALDRLISTEPIERRSADSSSALSRRHHVADLRRRLEALGESPVAQRRGAGGQLLARARGWDMPLGLESLTAALANFVAQAHEFLDIRADPQNRPCQVRFALAGEDEAGCDGVHVAAVAALDGLQSDLANALATGQDRLAVALLPSREDEGQMVAVTVLPPPTARGAPSVQIWQRLADLALSPHSALYRGRWAGRLRLAPGEDYGAPLPADTAMAELRRVVGFVRHVRRSDENGLLRCLSPEDQAEARRLEARLRVILRHNDADTQSIRGGGRTQYRLCCGQLPGSLGCGGENLAEIAVDVASAAAVPALEVTLELLRFEVGGPSAAGDSAWNAVVLLLAPIADLHKRPKIHQHWMAKYHVSNVVPCSASTVILFFGRPLSASEADAIPSSILKLKDVGLLLPGSTELAKTSVSRRVLVFKTETPYDQENELPARVLEALKKIGGPYSHLREVYVQVPIEDSIGTMDTHAMELMRQECVAESLLCFSARVELGSQERVLQELLFMCARLDDSPVQPDVMGGRILFLEAEAGAGCSTVMAQVYKQVMAAGGLAVFVSKSPALAATDMLKYMAEEIAMQLNSADRAGITASNSLSRSLVAVLDGLRGLDLRKVMFTLSQALSGMGKSGSGEGCLAKVFQRCSELGFLLSIVVSGERFDEEACSELHSSSIIIVQLEEISIREQLQIIRARTAALVTGSVTGNTQRLLKALENFLSRRGTGAPRATAKTVTPEYLIRALQMSTAMCPTALALDDSFPGDMLQLCDVILRSLAHCFGPSFLSLVLRILLNQDVLLSAKEVEQQFDPSQARDVRQILERLAPLLWTCPNVNSCFFLPQSTDTEVCSFLHSARARIYSLSWVWAITRLESSCIDTKLLSLQSPFFLSKTLLSIVSGEVPFAAESLDMQSLRRPRCPRTLKIYHLTSKSGTVAWECPFAAPNVFAGSFQIHGRAHGKLYQDLSARVERLRCQLGDSVVVPGTPASCRVRVEEGTHLSAWRVVTFQAPDKLSSPTLEPMDVTSGSILWTWSSPDTVRTDGDAIVIDGFQFEVEKDGIYTKLYHGKNTSYMQKDLKPNLLYTVRVCVYCATGVSDWTKRSVQTKLCKSQVLQSASRLISGSLKKYTASDKKDNELTGSVELAVSVQFSSGDPDSSGLWECATDSSFATLPFLLLSEKKLESLHKLLINPVYLQKYIEKQGVHSLYQEVIVPAKMLVNSSTSQATYAKDILDISDFIGKNLSVLSQSHITLSDLKDTPLAIKKYGSSIIQTIISQSNDITEVTEDLLASWEALRKLRHSLDLKLYGFCDDSGTVKSNALKSALHLEERLVLPASGESYSLQNLVACANSIPQDSEVADKGILLQQIAMVLEAEGSSKSNQLADDNDKCASYLKLLLDWDLSSLSGDEIRQKRGDLLDKCLGKKESLIVHCVRLGTIKTVSDSGASSLAIVCFEKSCTSEMMIGENVRSIKAAQNLVDLWQDSSSIIHSALSDLGVMSIRHLRSLYLVVCLALPLNVQVASFQVQLCTEIASALCVDLNSVHLHRVSSGCYVLLEVDFGSRDDVCNADLILDKLLAKQSNLTKFIISIQVIRQALPPVLPGENASIKVFNSSTFSDMHAERDLLNQLIYPAIRVFCLRRRVDFSWIDFRWGGVTEEDSGQHLGVVLCLNKIDECVISLGEHVSIPVLVGLVGERVGWVPASTSADRQVVHAKYSWSKSEEYDRYSVTALEMAYAFLRQPQSSESFFFLRDRKFMESQAFKSSIPISARQAFVDPQRKGRDLTTAELKRLIMDRAPGRWANYSVHLCDPAFSFSTRLTLSKVKELRKELTLAMRYFAGKSAPNIAKVMALKYEIMQWWLLLREQLDFQALAGSELPDADILGEVEACVADPFFSNLGHGEVDSASGPALGNSNVSAHGVRLDATAVGVAIGRCMRALVAAYFPHTAPLAAPHSHFLARALQEARVEAHAHPFAGDGRLRLVDWLVAEATAAERQGMGGIRAALLQAEPCQGTTAVLSAVVSRLLPLRDGEPGPAGARALLFFFAAPGRGGALEEAYRYLAAELALQHRGKAGLEEASALGPMGESDRDRFIRAVRRAAADDGGAMEGLVLVADGLSERDQLALIAAVRAGIETPRTDGAADVVLAPRRHTPFAATCILGPVGAAASAAPAPSTGGGRVASSLPVQRVALEPLNERERAAVCRVWMRHFGKENPSERAVEIAAGKGCSGGGDNDGLSEGVPPAYLALFCLEASTVGLFEGLDFELEQMPGDLCGLWRDRTLPRLEAVFGVPLVQAVMRQLLAHRCGASVDALRAVCLCDPDLAAQRRGLAARLERLIDALPPFLRRPGPCRPPRDLLLLHPQALVEATKARYAPCFLYHERRLASLARRRLIDAVAFRRTRGSVIEAPVASFSKPPPLPRRPDAVPTTAVPDPDPAAHGLQVSVQVPPQAWSFDPAASHRDLRPAGGNPPSRITKMGGPGSACTAVVAPAIPPDRDSYIEIRLDGPPAPAATGAGAGAGQYPIRVGVLHATVQALRRVMDGVAAGSQRGGYLFSCANGNLQTGGTGYSFVQATCGRDDCVGLRVSPARGEAILYLNAARVAPLPIHAHAAAVGPSAAPAPTPAAGRLDWSQLRFVVDLSHVGQSVAITGRPCPD